MATRIANLANNRLIQSVIAQTQARITDRQLQISTLQKSQDYAGISDESNRLVTLEASRRRVDQFMQEGAFVKLRMDTMLNSVNALKTTLSDVKGFINEVLEDGAVPNGVDKDEFANVKIAEIEDYLNVKVAGRYLFSGSKTDTKPVDIDDLDVATEPFDPPASATTTVAQPSFYYQGDDTKIKARINEGLEIQYGVTAANDAFEKLIRAVRIIRSVPLDGTGTNVTQKYEHARDLANEALEDMQSLELNLGTKVEQLNRTQNQLKDTKSFLAGTVSDLESANTFQAVAELTQDQTMLEASYNTMVRLSNLSMVKFLS